MAGLFDVDEYEVPMVPASSPTPLQVERAKWGGRSPVCTREWTRYRRRVLPILLARQGYLCALCGLSIDPEVSGNKAMGAHVDHVKPLASGGELIPEDDSELRAVHKGCNTARSNRTHPRTRRRARRREPEWW